MILVSGARVTIRASVLTTAVDIDAGFKSDIRTVVVGDDGAGVVFEEFSAGIDFGTVFVVFLAIFLEIVFVGLAGGAIAVVNLAVKNFMRHLNRDYRDWRDCPACPIGKVASSA
jgi:hypothetical protein